MKNITKRQGEYLSFISSYIKLNGKSPAEADIQRYFKVSPPTVHQMIVKLETIGAIKRQRGVARSIEVIIAEGDIPKYI